jgi:hypothetical protein
MRTQVNTTSKKKKQNKTKTNNQQKSGKELIENGLMIMK